MSASSESIMESGTDLTELKPVLLNDQTEVKVPVTSICTDHYDYCLSPSPMLPNTNQLLLSYNSEATYSQNELLQLGADRDTQADLADLNRLQDWLRDYPTDMFVNRLLVEYYKSETKLEQCRQMLFDILREADGFPFGVNCELKRRLNTRNGDSADIKLAYDVHKILSVIEGEDYSTLKDVITTSKKSTRRKSSVSSQDKCICKAEINQLKSTVTSLQADILLIKQRQCTTENVHSGEIKSLRDSLNRQQNELSDEQALLKTCVDNMKVRITKLESVVMEEVKICKNFIQTNSESVKQAQDQLLRISFAFAHLKSCVESYGIVHQDYQPVAESDTNISPTDTQTKNDVNQRPVDSTSASGDSTLVNDPKYRKRTNNDQSPSIRTVTSTVANMESDVPHDFTHIPTRITERSQNKQEKSVSFADVCRLPKHAHEGPADGSRSTQYGPHNDTTNAPQQNTCLVLDNDYRPAIQADTETTCVSQSSLGITDYMTTEEMDDFLQHVRRRTKRFYIGGFKHTITEQKLVKFVESKGPKVTKVTIFRNRKHKTVVIRINIEDDGKSHYLTADPYFWPRGITCRPWMSRNAYENRNNYPLNSHSSELSHGRKYDRPRKRSNPNYDNARAWDQYTNSDYNHYSVLDVDVE